MWTLVKRLSITASIHYVPAAYKIGL